MNPEDEAYDCFGEHDGSTPCCGCYLGPWCQDASEECTKGVPNGR